MKPLFIPLKAEWFEAFASGRKHVEYRRYGPGWNERTCTVGRPVILSRGYGWPRMRAVIARFDVLEDRNCEPIYPRGTRIAAIHLKEIRR